MKPKHYIYLRDENKKMTKIDKKKQIEKWFFRWWPFDSSWRADYEYAKTIGMNDPCN